MFEYVGGLFLILFVVVAVVHCYRQTMFVYTKQENFRIMGSPFHRYAFYPSDSPERQSWVMANQVYRTQTWTTKLWLDHQARKLNSGQAALARRMNRTDAQIAFDIAASAAAVAWGAHMMHEGKRKMNQERWKRESGLY